MNILYKCPQKITKAKSAWFLGRYGPVFWKVKINNSNTMIYFSKIQVSFTYDFVLSQVTVEIFYICLCSTPRKTMDTF